MPRFKNSSVELPPVTEHSDGSRSRSWESIQAGLLMDLRDELQANNALQRETVRLLNRIDRRLRQVAPLRSSNKT